MKTLRGFVIMCVLAACFMGGCATKGLVKVKRAAFPTNLYDIEVKGDCACYKDQCVCGDALRYIIHNMNELQKWADEMASGPGYKD